MKPNIKNLIFSIFVILFNLINPSHSLSTNENAQLALLASNLGITWIPSSTNCLSYSNVGSQIICNSNNNAEELKLVCTNFGTISSVDFSKFTALKKITFINCGVTIGNTILNHASLKELYSISLNTTASFINLTTSTKTFNANLTKLYLENAYGVLPTFTNPGILTNYTVLKNIGQGLVLSGGASIQTGLFTPSLIHYEIILSSPPTTPLLYNVTSTATKLINFRYSAPGSTIPFANFYQVPSTLKILYLEGNINAAMPSFASTNWTGLVSLSLVNCGISGTLDLNFLYLPNLKNLNINGNGGLAYSLTTEFGEKSKLYSLFSESTGLFGTVPSNVLDGGLQFFYVRNTPLTGALPSAFMCCSSDALYVRSIPPSYLFDADGSFSNYNGPLSPRSCSPIINTISPSPITTNSTYMTISGSDLGDSFQIIMANTLGQTTSVGCSILLQNLLECVNPLIQGSGDLTFRLVVGSLPTFKTNFTYSVPVITSVSSPPTLGGTVTISGYELFRANNPEGSSVKIYAYDCTNIKVIIPFQQFTCDYVPGITSGVLVYITVKGLINNPSTSPTFSYRAPLVTGSSAIPFNTQSNLTISGQDFWNDISLASVTIGESISCPVLSVSHSILICDFPATAFTSESLNINVTINGQSSQPNKLFQFVDTSYCPQSCNSGSCDAGIGSCVCKNIFGPSCSEGSKSLIPLPEQGLETPTLTLKSPLNSSVPLNCLLYSIVENSAETIIPSWVSSYDSDSQTWLFTWEFFGKNVQVRIRYNNAAGNDSLFGSPLTYPASSFTYMVSYTTTSPVVSLGFKFEFISLEKCPTAPVFAYPTNQNQNARWMTWIKDIVKYYIRFPLISLLNGEYSQITTNLVESTEANKTKVLVKFPEDVIYSSSFQFDYEVVQATPRESKILNNNCLVNPTPTLDPNVDKIETTSKSNKNAAIIGGVVGSIGGAIMILGAVFIVKQQMKIKKTNSLLDQKLRNLNRTNTMND